MTKEEQIVTRWLLAYTVIIGSSFLLTVLGILTSMLIGCQ